jgi:phage gpG-like protein
VDPQHKELRIMTNATRIDERLAKLEHELDDVKRLAAELAELLRKTSRRRVEHGPRDGAGMSDTWATMPDEVAHVLDQSEPWPEGLLTLRDYAESHLEGLSRKLEHAISNDYSDAGILGQAFTYAVGVRVGRALAAGVDIGQAEAVALVADAAAAWTADNDVLGDVRATVAGWRRRQGYPATV